MNEVEFRLLRNQEVIFMSLTFLIENNNDSSLSRNDMSKTIFENFQATESLLNKYYRKDNVE